MLGHAEESTSCDDYIKNRLVRSNDDVIHFAHLLALVVLHLLLQNLPLALHPFARTTISSTVTPMTVHQPPVALQISMPQQISIHR